MALKTGAQYLEEMKSMRPNIYKWGRLIEDVTTDPVTRTQIHTVARSYDYSFDPETEGLYTTTSYLTGQKAHRWNTIMHNAEESAANAAFKRDTYRRYGTCPGPVCAGWTIMNAFWGVTYDMDKEYGTDYHERLKKFAAFSEEKALSMCGALTDAKGNRAVKAGQQKNKDSYVHVVEQRPDGVVICGHKNQIEGVASAQWIMIIPTTAFGEDEKEYCIAAAIPRDAEGITVVQTRSASDTRSEEPEGWDAPRKSGADSSYIIFDHVFIPKEYVFMNGEYKYSGQGIGNFTAIYRAAIGGCVAGQGDVMIGAALGLARANGLTQKAFQEKLTRMAVNNETCYGLGLGAIYNGKQHPSGAYYPDPLLAHVNKIHVAYLPAETKLMCVDISGGIAEAGCMPSYIDMRSPIYGQRIIKSLEAGCDAESRIKLARLIEWIIIGSGMASCLHGGGSPDSAKLTIKALTKWDKYVDFARDIMDIEVPLKEEKKK